MRTLLLTTALLVVAACGSDGSGTDDSFGIGPPTTVAPETTEPSPTTAGPATSVAPATTAPGTTAAPTTTAAPGPLPEPNVALFEIGDFDRPVDVTHRPGSGETFVVEQPGRVRAVTDLSDDVVLDVTDLTRAQGEQGLLGLAFHPSADLAYIHFTDLEGDTVVAELAVDPSTGALDRSSLRALFTVDQPFGNHNGGGVVVGPDGLLYIGLGDGGSADDPLRAGLDLSTPLGKILRIDPTPSGDAPFTVPADNPFVDDPTAEPTVWTSGLRNPWRFSFDSENGDLWIADVGQNRFEEVNRLAGPTAGRGVDLGWSAFEGFERFNDDQTSASATPPLFVYDHDGGRCSISGGAVARGGSVTDLDGWYVFGDYCSGQIWALDPTAPPTDPRVLQIAALDTVVAVSEGPDGDLFAVSNGGTVARIVPA